MYEQMISPIDQLIAGHRQALLELRGSLEGMSLSENEQMLAEELGEASQRTIDSLVRLKKVVIENGHRRNSK